jgi:type II secretory pathway component PulF
MMRGSYSRKAVLEFTQMMEMLLESGLSLRDALEMLTGMESGGASRLGQGILERIRKGASFARALCSMKNVFSPVYRGMIRVGDKAGSVERIFPRLNCYLEEQKKLRDKTLAALTYPALVFVLTITGAAFLVLFVLPKMEDLFGGFGGPGEKIQRNIKTIETVIMCFLYLFVFLTIGIAVLKTLGKQYPEFALSVDYILLMLPLAGSFLSFWESLNFSFAMEALTGGGVSVEAALEEAEAVISNRAYRRALTKVREAVYSGKSLSSAFGGQKIFPSCLSRWIAIGEGSGKTEKVFSQLRNYFQEEIERLTSQFQILIEPALIGIIGVVILIFVVGIIIPLFSVYGNII